MDITRKLRVYFKKSVDVSFISLNKIVAVSLIILSLLLVLLLTFTFNEFKKTEDKQTLEIVYKPRIDDILFLDARLTGKELRPTHRYQIAKVIDITGDVISLSYGDFYYPHQHAALKSIKYGQLSYPDYFQPKRFDIAHDTLLSMLDEKVIYLAKRPIRGKLFGRNIGISKEKDLGSHLTYGWRENFHGEAFLSHAFNEMSMKSAFELFSVSAELNFPQGQVNLAQMYLNGQYIEQDKTLALYWLNKAAIQGHKPAIFKYGIVCGQVKNCNVYDFYQALSHHGINIKVRDYSFSLEGSTK